MSVSTTARLDSGKHKFSRLKYFPPDSSESVAKFLSLFHRYSYIYKPLNGGSWHSSKEQWKLSDTEILKAASCAHQKFFIGCRVGRAARFAVLDIDAHSKYHNKDQLNRIRALLTKAGIRKTVAYRSSSSEGWHIYIFFDEHISSRDLRSQLVQLFRLHDFEIAKGKLEIFPAPGEGSLGNGLRLPLQEGFAFLNQETLVVSYERFELAANKAVQWFVEDLMDEANSRHDFHRLKRFVEELSARKEQLSIQVSRQPAAVIPIKRSNAFANAGATQEVTTMFGYMPPGIIAERWLAGRTFYETGLIGPSQRADAICSLSHYLFYGDPSRSLSALGYGYEEDRQWVIQEILASKHNGNSKDINRGCPDSTAQITRAAHWLPVHKRGNYVIPYKAQVPIAWVRHNANQQKDARNRIQKAVKEFTEKRQPFSIRDLKALAQCSEPTLYKHQDLWRVAQEKLWSNRLATALPEYNAGEGVGCPKTQPPSPSDNTSMPPGLLAARRIIYEISTRTRRQKRQVDKATIRCRQAIENDWRSKVAVFTRESPAEIPPEKIKPLLSVLTHYLCVAPNEDDAIALQSYTSQLRQELFNKMHGPQPPPR